MRASAFDPMPSQAKRTRARKDSLKDAKEILDAIRRIVRGLRLASRASERNVGLSAANLLTTTETEL